MWFDGIHQACQVSIPVTSGLYSGTTNADDPQEKGVKFLLSRNYKHYSNEIQSDLELLIQPVSTKEKQQQ